MTVITTFWVMVISLFGTMGMAKGASEKSRLYSVRFNISASKDGFLLPSNAFLTFKRLNRSGEGEKDQENFLIEKSDTPKGAHIARGSLSNGTYTVFFSPLSDMALGSPAIPLMTIKVHADMVRKIALPPLASIRIRISVPEKTKIPLLASYLLITGAGEDSIGYRGTVLLEPKNGKGYIGQWDYAVPNRKYRIKWLNLRTLEELQLGTISLKGVDVRKRELVLVSKRQFSEQASGGR